MPNGIDLIRADHELVDQLFAEFSATGQGSPVGQIVDALKAHDEAEHFALYALTRELLGDVDVIKRADAAHSAVKRQIDLVCGLEGPPLEAAVEKLRILVQAHVADEEKNLLPALGEAATPEQLDALGARIMQVKQRGG
jgi:hemerythrin superfamily protein